MSRPAPASAGIAALLAELFDDAGVFPPASLPLDEAFADHRTAMQGEFRWMLGRFVVPSSRLDELAVVAPRYGDALRLALVIDEAPGRSAAIASLIDDHGWRVDSIERRLVGPEISRDAMSLVNEARSIGADHCYLEIPWEDPTVDMEAAVDALAMTGAGAKVRCGGAVAGDYPQPATLAELMKACHERSVRLKATAGLHHPFRHPDPLSGAMSHGFLNLVMAAALVSSGALEETLLTVLADDRSDSFTATATGARWAEHEADGDAIRSCRQSLLTSIGTCSFREPVDDLVAFGLLAPS